MGLKKIERKKKPLIVANQLLKAIKTGDFQVGDRLPPEEKLAEKTGVSRASVREALSALRLGEIVQTKVGKGTFVKEVPSDNNIKDEIRNILVNNPKPLELQEARAAFEVGIGAIAAVKFSDQDEKEIDNTLKLMKSAAEEDNYQDFLKLHKQFHLMIAEATDNKVIEDTLRNFQGIMNDDMWEELESMHFLPDKRGYLFESLSIHRKIFLALKDADPELARDRMRDHFERYSQ